MASRTGINTSYVRVIALLSLGLGLNDAARLLGVWPGEGSPLASLGTTGFVLLAVFSLSRLFAGVGLWIKASWGAVLAAGATLAELAMAGLGSPDVRMTAVGAGFRILLVAGIMSLAAIKARQARMAVHD